MIDGFSAGFLIPGDVRQPRCGVDWFKAWEAFSECAETVRTDQESFLSMFLFPPEFLTHLQQTGSTANYAGDVWCPFLWIDIDAADLGEALRQARAFIGYLGNRFRLDGEELLCFFSGKKGFHIGIPATHWNPQPGPLFHRACRVLAEAMAQAAGITIDRGVYDKVRAFRSPNSRHPATGKHKRMIPAEHLLRCSLESILELASRPAPFDFTMPAALNPDLAQAWGWAMQQAGELHRQETRQPREHATINRMTWDFIRGGAEPGDRHRLLFSSAANLEEFPTKEALIHALLKKPGEETGLSPADVARQIQCGIEHVRGDQP